MYRDLLVGERADSPLEFTSALVVELTPCQSPFHDALASSDQPLKPRYSLAIIVS